MLKSVSSVVNAIGALNYVGTWNASTNTPTLVSGTGTKGDYYVVSVAGSTSLNGISNWGVGDWVVFNGSAWQRVEGGADLNGVNLSVSGTSTMDGNVTFKDNLTQGTAGKGVNFTANTPASGVTSQLLNWYEQGAWTPEYSFSGGGTATSTNKVGYYTRVGRLVVANFYIYTDSLSAPVGNATISGLPFASGNLSVNLSAGALFEVRRFATDMPNLRIGVTQNSSVITIYKQATNSSSQTPINATDFNATAAQNLLSGTVTYIAA